MKTGFKILSVLFVAFIAMRKIYSPEGTFLGVYLTLDTIVIFSFFFYILINMGKMPAIKSLSPPVKYAVFFIVFYLILLNGTIFIKEIIYEGEPFSLLIKRLFRSIIGIYCFLYIIKDIKYVKYKKLIINTINWTLVFLVISSIFSEWLLSIGLIPSIREMTGISRNTGFLGLNPNEAALFYCLTLGYSLLELGKKLPEVKKRAFFLMASLSMLGVLLMVSKTGFAVMLALFLLFFYRNVSRLRFFLKEGLLLIGISIVIFLFSGDNMIERVDRQFGGQEDTYSSRMSYNHLYFNEVLTDRSIFLYGKSDQARPHKQNPHNLYIFTFYYGGIFIFSLLVFIVFKFFRFSFFGKHKENAFLFLPIIFASLGGFGGYSMWIILLVALANSEYIIYYEPKNISKSRHRYN